MAMLTKSFETLQLGNKRDVCILCAKKKKIRYAEAKQELQGLLENKKILRANSEICYCIDCLKELVESADNKQEGVNL